LLVGAPSCIYRVPDPGEVGTVSRNSLVGPAYTRTDMSILRTFPLREGMRFLFRAEALSVFNTPNLAQPEATVSALNNIFAGRITNTTGSNTVAGPVGRRLQLSGTFYF
jgi:hypothetical protein